MRVVEFNVENLFVLMDQYSGQNLTTLSESQWQKLSISVTANKPLDQVRGVARAILELQPDVLMLCEVGGLQSLINFNRYFLGEAYSPFLLEGNSERGIDLGYLVKKSLPLKYDLISHKHRPIDFLYPHEKQTKLTGYEDAVVNKVTSHRFSRDVLELRVFDGNDQIPALIFLMVHLKSPLDRDRIDPMGRDRRKAELEKLVKIYLEIENEFSKTVPIVLGGDFNGIAQRDRPDPEFTSLFQETDLTDVLELAGLPVEERFTHMQIHQNRTALSRQIDYLFVSAALRNRVISKESFIFRFRDEFDMPMLIPRNMNEKRLLPSDHYPVVTTLGPNSARSQQPAGSGSGSVSG